MPQKHKHAAHDFILWAALPMARTARVESRLRMILKPQQDRRALTRRAVVGSLVAAALGVGALAALRPEARVRDNMASWTQTLPNGATVEMIGVSNLPPGRDGWWKRRDGWWGPDGSSIAALPYGPITSFGGKEKYQRVFAVRVTPPSGSPEQRNMIYKIQGASLNGWITGLLPSSPQLSGIYLVCLGTENVSMRATLQCGLTAGPWETLTSQYVIPASGAMKSVDLRYQHAQVDVIFSRTSEVGGNVAVTVTNTLPDTLATWRVLAVDTAGKIYTSRDGGRIGGPVQQETCVFVGLPRKRVRAFQFQVRPYQWAEFKGIAMTPDRK